MSDVTAILTSIVDVKRFTASVVDAQAVAGTITASRNPGRAARLEVTLQGCTYGVNPAVLMHDSGGSTNETILFSQDGAKVGLSNFTTLNNIQLVNITGGTVKVRAVSDMGQPINQETLVIAGLSCRYFQNTGYTKEFQGGQQLVSHRIRYGLMLEPVPAINIMQNDRVYNDYGIFPGLTMMMVDFVEALYDFAGSTHHLEAWLIPI